MAQTLGNNFYAIQSLGLDGVLFTHEHADHTAGLDDIRPFFFRQGNIDFYASQKVFSALDIRFSYIME